MRKESEPMTQVAIFSVKYSPNLGDGLLSECLEAELVQQVPGLHIKALDLAGRTSYGNSVPHRKLALRILEALPLPLRQIVARTALQRLASRQLHPTWKVALADCDAAIIGGGNLFADADLNFPIKIHAALVELRARAIPVAVYGVGVTRNWSLRGASLFGQGLSSVQLVDVTVRDERSQRIWNDLLRDHGVRLAGRAYDPGLLTARHFPSGALKDAGIGFCITDPVALRYHAASGTISGDLTGWYGETILALARSGQHVSLFTNGSPEDVAYLSANAGAWNEHEMVTISPTFDRPAQLVDLISRCELVIGHRMHACIAAHSYGIPTIGLAWDVKLNSFFDVVGRSEWVIDPADTPAGTMPQLAAQAAAEGIDAAVLKVLIADCQKDVGRLADALFRGVARLD
jgi:polysaccharide pyruvyl transferase WcaK-like protein